MAMPRSVWLAAGLEFRDDVLEREVERGLVLGRFQIWPTSLFLQLAISAVFFWEHEDRSLWIRFAL